MPRPLGCILMAILAVSCGVQGCGEKRESAGPRLTDPPVAPLTEPNTNPTGDSTQNQGGPASDGQETSTARANQPRGANWPYRPTALRLHPLTHALRSAEGVSVIEARIEFFDRFGHTTKGLGVLRFELRGSDGVGSRRLASWEIDAASVELNMRHYDDVTRTYLFRLGLEGVEDLPATGRLEVTAIMPNQRMTGSFDIALR